MDDDHAFPLDPITGLPWSASIREQASAWALGKELHALVLEVAGLGALIDAFGYRAGHSTLKQIGRLVARQLDGRDLLGRHAGASFLIITQRPYSELESLVRMIREHVFTLSIETAEGRIPEGRFGIAGMDPVGPRDEATGAVDALIISAEIALRHVGTPRVAPAAGNRNPEARHEVSGPSEPEEVFAGAARATASPVPETPAAVDVAVVEIPDEDALPAYEIEAEPMEPEKAPVPEPEPTISFAPAPVNGPGPLLEEPSPAAVQVPAAPVPAESAGTDEAGPEAGGDPKRVTFVRCNVSDSGMAATIEVEIRFGGKTSIGKVVGRKAADRLPYLIGEATGRALTELLPHGFGVVLQDLHHVTQGDTEALWATVMLVNPEGEEKLLGIAPGRDDGHSAPAKAVLNAINRRLSLILKPAS